MNETEVTSGHANFSKLLINDIVGEYEKMIVEFEDGTIEEFPFSAMAGVTEFKFEKPAKEIKFIPIQKKLHGQI